MLQGERVRYTEAHWEWMGAAGLLLQHGVKREHYMGSVADADENSVEVEWDFGAPFPRRMRNYHQRDGRHLADNLETV